MAPWDEQFASLDFYYPNELVQGRLLLPEWTCASHIINLLLHYLWSGNNIYLVPCENNPLYIHHGLQVICQWTELENLKMTNQNWGDVTCDGCNWSVLNYSCTFADKGLANHGILGNYPTTQGQQLIAPLAILFLAEVEGERYMQHTHSSWPLFSLESNVSLKYTARQDVWGGQKSATWRLTMPHASGLPLPSSISFLVVF